jgi:hypothetical protein
VLQKRDFTIIFRTFGADIIEVVDEMNMFASGQHPYYPEVGHHAPSGPDHTCCHIRSCFIVQNA